MSKHYEIQAVKIIKKINSIFEIMESVENVYRKCDFDKMTENEAINIGYCVEFLQNARDWVMNARDELSVGENFDSTKYETAQRDWIVRNDICRGSKVRITRTAEEGEDGWSGKWYPCLDKYVGHVGIVHPVYNTRDESDSSGIRIDTRDDNMWFFPYFVLEKVEE